MSQLISADYFLLRTPTLPWDVVESWCEGLSAVAADADGGDLDAALARDAGVLRARLRDIVRLAEVQAALQVASPSLCGKLQPWLDGDEREAALSVEPALVRYVMRMAGRATPFGLFAGTTLGKLGARNHLRTPAPEQQQRHSRLNLDCLVTLAARLAEREACRPHVRFRANDTMYETAGRHRYYAMRLSPKNQRSYHLCDIAASPYAELALQAARRSSDGATIADIADALAAASEGIEAAEACDYVAHLVRIGLLCPTLIPAVTGPDALRQLLAELRRIPTAGDAVAVLEAVRADLQALDAAPFDARDGVVERIGAALTALAPGIDLTYLVRVDLRKPSAEVTLSASVLDEIRRAAELMVSINGPRESAMDSFVGTFEERYQEREVPLLEMLDTETGIGFGSAVGAELTPLIKGLVFEPPPDEPVRISERGRFLVTRLTEALRAGATTIDLSPRDLEALSPREQQPLPAGQSVMATLVAPSEAALDDGNFRILLNCVGGTTSGSLVGRFLQDDPELATHARATLRQEEAREPDALHAEIAHHLEGVATNVNCRPHLRDYEIDVAGGSAMPWERRIPLSDLLVSVRNGELQLRSKRHGKRVVPHLSTAHNYVVSGFPAYRFLTILQGQGKKCDQMWWWGALLEEAPFLPRVTCGRVVLTLARWKIAAARVSAIQALRGAARFSAVQALRRELKLARQVRLVDGDNLLPVDLDNVLSIEAMLGACKSDEPITLSEAFPGGDELVAHGAGGGFYHELVVPLLRAPAPAPAPVSRPLIEAVSSIAPRPDLSRRPGEDWLYLKLYCGLATFDRLLVDLVTPLISELRADRLVDRWFFIRYNDSGWHMRLRLQGAPQTLWTAVAPRALQATERVRALVHRVAIDTYDPEVERYGGPEGLGVAERVFEADSDAVAGIVARHRSDSEARWRIALVGMNAMLDDLGFSIEEKQQIVSRARDGQARNVRPGAVVARQLGEQFRARRLELEQLVVQLPDKYAAAAELLQQRSAVLRRQAPQLRELAQRGQLGESMSSIATSYLHMWANRIFRGSQNTHEYVLYDFLQRTYRGALARARPRHGATNAARQATGR